MIIQTELVPLYFRITSYNVCYTKLLRGVRDEDICKAVNLIVEHKGGICAVSDSNFEVIPLPIAGIMSEKDGRAIGKQYESLDKMAKQLGSTLHAPYMTLSFMALLVIPSLKLSDKGLFA